MDKGREGIGPISKIAEGRCGTRQCYFCGSLECMCHHSGYLVRAGMFMNRSIIQHVFESDVFVSSNLIDLYAKCGSMEDARRVFNKNTRAQCSLLDSHAQGLCHAWAG